MRLVVLDTNVVLSAGIQGQGIPARIVNAILDGELQAVTCPSVVAEYREVVRRPKFARFKFPPAWLEFLVSQSLQLPEPPPWPLDGPDPDDLVFLALADLAGAMLVTGNLADYPESIRGGVTVFTPKDYWDRLEGR